MASRASLAETGGTADTTAPLDTAAHAHPTERYEISRALTWYAMAHETRSASKAYGDQLLTLGTAGDFRQFAAYYGHIPKPSQVFDGKHAWKIGDKHVGFGIAVFDATVRPEWEDPGNRKGIDLVVRHAFAPAALDETWVQMLLLLVNGELEEATGVRLVCKHDRRGVMHKLEVWARTTPAGRCCRSACQRAPRPGFAIVPRREIGVR